MKTTPTHIEVPRRLLRYADVAHYLGIGKRGVEQLAKDGELPKVMIGNRVLFDREDVDAYIERLKVSS